MSIQLRDNEVIIREDVANHFKGIEGVGGRLWLTSLRLFFKSHSVNIQIHEESYWLNEIESVQPKRSLGVIPNAISIRLKGGRDERFVVFGQQDWVDKISEALDGNVNVPTDSQIKINLSPQLIRTRANVEEIFVPPGVTIKVKRSRTIEHTIDVNWQQSSGGNIEIGIKQFVSTSIREEIEHGQKQGFQQSETIEYKVELNGEKGNRYNLIWTDVWRNGTVELQQGDKTNIVPFQVREWAELAVVSIDAENK